jgi:hypothetical protein
MQFLPFSDLFRFDLDRHSATHRLAGGKSRSANLPVADDPPTSVGFGGPSFGELVSTARGLTAGPANDHDLFEIGPLLSG